MYWKEEETVVIYTPATVQVLITEEIKDKEQRHYIKLHWPDQKIQAARFSVCYTAVRLMCVEACMDKPP